MSGSYQDWSPAKIGWGGFVKKLYRHHKPAGGIFILRLVLGILFVAAGWWKINNMGMVVGYFGTMGFSAFQAYLVSWVELVGGLFLILGILTKPTCVAFAIEMAVIVWGTDSTPSIIYFGHDYQFVLLGCFLALYIMGPGTYSLAHLWLKKKGERKSK